MLLSLLFFFLQNWLEKNINLFTGMRNYWLKQAEGVRERERKAKEDKEAKERNAGG